MHTVTVSFVNVYGFSIVTTHFDAAGVRLRIEELARVGVEASAVSAAQGGAPAPRPQVTRRKRKAATP